MGYQVNPNVLFSQQKYNFSIWDTQHNNIYGDDYLSMPCSQINRFKEAIAMRVSYPY